MQDDQNIEPDATDVALSELGQEKTEEPFESKDTRKAGAVSRLLCLYFRPKKFFEEHAASASRWTVALVAYVFGIAWVLTDSLKPEKTAAFSDDAATRGVAVIVYALLSGTFFGAIWYFAAGSWYGLRLWLFCRTPRMSWKLARRTFIFAELIYALPCAVGMAIWWVVQDRSILSITIVSMSATLFWSLYVSYRGARTAFHASRRRSIVLFVLVPGLLYGGAIAGSFLRKRMQPIRAAMSVPIENPCISMNRPANWKLVNVPESVDGVFFQIPDAGYFSVAIASSESEPVDLEGTAQLAMQTIVAKFPSGAKELDRFSHWGKHSGHGISYEIFIDGQEFNGRVFCCSLPDGRSLMVAEFGLVGAQLEPQFKIVRDSLEVKPIRRKLKPIVIPSL